MSNDQVAGYTSRSKSVQGRRLFLGSAIAGVASMSLISPISANAEPDDCNPIASAADSLYFYIQLIPMVQSSVLIKASDTLNEPLSRLATITLEIKSRAIELEKELRSEQQSGRVERVHGLADLGQESVHLIRASLESARISETGIMALTAVAKRINSATAALDSSQHTISQRAWDIIQEILRLVRGLDTANTDLQTAQAAYREEQKKIGEKIKGLEKNMMDASVAVANGNLLAAKDYVLKAISVLSAINSAPNQASEDGQHLLDLLKGTSLWITNYKAKSSSVKDSPVGNEGAKLRLVSMNNVTGSPTLSEETVNSLLKKFCEPDTYLRILWCLGLVTPIWFLYPGSKEKDQRHHLIRDTLKLFDCRDDDKLESLASGLADLHF